jgi:hypothetical protein
MGAEFVDNIVKSLREQPEAWTLDEFEWFVWKECDYYDPDKEPNGHPTIRGSWKKISHKGLRLTHRSGDVVLLDNDALDYKGWTIEKPAHIHIGFWARRRLWKAVKAWRGDNLQKVLAGDQTKALEAALHELEQEGL